MIWPISLYLKIILMTLQWFQSFCRFLKVKFVLFNLCIYIHIWSCKEIWFQVARIITTTPRDKSIWRCPKMRIMRWYMETSCDDLEGNMTCFHNMCNLFLHVIMQTLQQLLSTFLQTPAHTSVVIPFLQELCMLYYREMKVSSEVFSSVVFSVFVQS